MLDAHCHLVPPYFEEKEIEDLLQKCSALGIRLFPVASCHGDFQFLTSGDFEFPFIGVHPIQNGKAVTIEEFNLAKPLMETLLCAGRAFGIGEIGIDYQKHIIPNEDIKDAMRIVFMSQLEMAKIHDCFVNVHSRQAGHYAIEMMQEIGIEKAIFHAFDGKAKYALDAVANNQLYFFTIPGTIQRNLQTQKFAALLPLTNMLVESDAPALGPVKGKLATPLDIPGTIDFIAKLRNLPVKELRQILDSNAERIFKTNPFKIR